MNSTKRLLDEMGVVPLRGYQANSTPNDAHSPSGTVFLDQGSMSSLIVDQLEELQRNWIGTLGFEWELDPSGGSWGAAEAKEGKPRSLTLHQLIASIQPSRYESIVIGQTYWVHTVCLRVVGLGRVRLVLCFDNPELVGKCIVLATDRLDWSPRNILTQWLQALLSGSLDCWDSSELIRSYSVSFSFTDCSTASISVF